MLPVECFMQNVPIKGQLKNAFGIYQMKKILVFLSVIYAFLNCFCALNLMLVFLVIFNRCDAKLNLLSMMTPNTEYPYG